MRIVDRVTRLARSFVIDREREPSDVAAALAELDDFLRGDGEDRPRRNEHDAPDEVLRAYRALELAPTAGATEAKHAYRRLLTTYHPDRFASNGRDHRTAGEVTRRLTEAYAIVRRYQLQGGRS